MRLLSAMVLGAVVFLLPFAGITTVSMSSGAELMTLDVCSFHAEGSPADGSALTAPFYHVTACGYGARFMETGSSIQEALFSFKIERPPKS